MAQDRPAEIYGLMVPLEKERLLVPQRRGRKRAAGFRRRRTSSDEPVLTRLVGGRDDDVGTTGDDVIKGARPG